MAGHVGLRKAQALAREGKPVDKPSIGWGGSMNYGYMRIVTAMLEYHRRGDQKRFKDGRIMWLDCEDEQLTVGHWSRAQQCEQLCPQPHSDFTLDAVVDLWLWSLGMGCDPAVLDLELAASCQANMARSVALWRVLNVGGIVCAPSARAKDDEGTGQWRNRPADKILALVEGRKGIKYDSVATMGMERLLARPGVRQALLDAPMPLLRVPVHMVRRDGGYAAWYSRTAEAERAMGHDGLTCVIHERAGAPRVLYDWQEPLMGVAALVGERKVVTIGNGMAALLPGVAG